ncbi:MAG: hypothetical protein AB1792_11855 [Candidatus Zixiibacteriota bacterium]
MAIKPHKRSRCAVMLPLLLAALSAGCSSTDSKCKVDTSYNPSINAGAFVAAVTNPLFPLQPGTVFVYAEGEDTVEVTVLAEKKTILGVSCTIVHDVLRSGTEVIEDTYDWFAQDTAGAVWYFGEDTKEMSGGHVVSTKGSWEAGVDGAQPGILIPSHPSVGQQYRQEYYACVAEDMGEVLDLNASADVPFGTFTNCLRTRDFTPLEPDVNENKYYFPGIGPLLTVDLTNGTREELVRVTVPTVSLPKGSSSKDGC